MVDFMNKNKRKGFTLIELIAVLVILAILALIVTPLVMNIIREFQRIKEVLMHTEEVLSMQ